MFLINIMVWQLHQTQWSSDLVIRSTWSTIFTSSIGKDRVSESHLVFTRVKATLVYLEPV